MLISEWPEEARKSLKECISLKREVYRIFPERVASKDQQTRNEKMDRLYLLAVKISFEMGKTISILRESVENTSLNESYRSQLREDLELMERRYSIHSESAKSLFEDIQKNKWTNSPDDFQAHKRG